MWRNVKDCDVELQPGGKSEPLQWAECVTTSVRRKHTSTLITEGTHHTDTARGKTTHTHTHTMSVHFTSYLS